MKNLAFDPLLNNASMSEDIELALLLKHFKCRLNDVWNDLPQEIQVTTKPMTHKPLLFRKNSNYVTLLYNASIFQKNIINSLSLRSWERSYLQQQYSSDTVELNSDNSVTFTFKKKHNKSEIITRSKYIYNTILNRRYTVPMQSFSYYRKLYDIIAPYAIDDYETFKITEYNDLVMIGNFLCSLLIKGPWCNIYSDTLIQQIADTLYDSQIIKDKKVRQQALFFTMRIKQLCRNSKMPIYSINKLGETHEKSNK